MKLKGHTQKEIEQIAAAEFAADRVTDEEIEAAEARVAEHERIKAGEAANRSTFSTTPHYGAGRGEAG